MVYTVQMKRIIILGAGFAGIRCALDLEKKLRGSEYEIVLINKRDSHIYRPDLYEVATAYYSDISGICKTQLTDTVAIPLNKIFDHKKIKLIVDSVTSINQKEKTVTLEHNNLISYSILVVALGSAVNYFDIPGLKENSHSLKTASDAIALCCHVDGIFYERWKENRIDPISIVIGGGGATGVEYAAELSGYVKKLSQKYHYPLEHVSIKIIEGGNQLAGQTPHGTEVILKRLRDKKITVEMQARITKVEAEKITVQTEGVETQIAYSFLVWSGGVMPHPLIKKTFKDLSIKGGVVVNEYLQTTENEAIFACGDSAAITDSKTQKPAPWLAQCAVHQGALVAENILKYRQKKAMQPYSYALKGIVIPIGKKYGILERNGKILTGMTIWFLRRMIDLTYSMSILPWWYAIKKWFTANRVFAKND